MIINSKQNSRIKEFAALKQKKFREQSGLFLVEGVKMTREAFKYNKNVKAVIGLKQYVDEYADSGVEIIEVSEEVLEHISDAVTPQGIISVLEIPHEKVDDITDVCVCLDRVSDAGNLGTILRICAACGVKDIYLINCVDGYAPKTVRSSMSGIFLVNLHEITAEEFALHCKVPVISADMDGENIFEYKPSGKFCLLLGSEAHGVSEQMQSLASATVKIPMLQNMESLNVGVSCGVILYQLLKHSFN